MTNPFDHAYTVPPTLPRLSTDTCSTPPAPLGQCALITRAKLDLVPAAHGPHLAARIHRQPDVPPRPRTLTPRGELDGIYNIRLPSGTALTYQLNAVAYYDPGSPPDDNHLLRELSIPPPAVVKLDTSYPDFIFRIDEVPAAYQAAGWDNLIKPWFDVCGSPTPPSNRTSAR
jgi:hypothetical protein